MSRFRVGGTDDAGGEWVAISSLLPADSPRLAGESVEHIRTLAASDAALPPIVVQRASRRIVDGMHRVQAVKLRGNDEIRVLFYDGDDEDAFIVAVAANIAHGLPLSQTDRTAAAARILGMRPQWSDRKIASVTGLAATTVGGIRKRLIDASGRLNALERVGKDGKVRPVDAKTGRLRASELIAQRPDAPIREIAKAAGVSPATALDVRNRLRDGLDPIPRGYQKPPASPQVSYDILLKDLKRDPSLRFTDSGRALLRWLDAHSVDQEQLRQYADTIPAHCTRVIARLAQHNITCWKDLLQHIESRDL
ncbi:ParB-like chromosome segregation protein Spo0J [Kibdelosporangium banguiense]|uniref:ParB-like chromosome segregation protein Spo0J n=1 Tax=Kibdelosporangium banguiense TaxID=1365924 RepID=A0ABS4TFF9_9PSEU|nr:ParB N-terminal domain-containing protein [Kibdelosporangium banguiense]MBP2323152.1 ParB-like chromosome segregation protein Spo0J [Kibdelosporangium banguiense]